MKKLLFLLLLPLGLSAQPIYVPATQAEVDAGILRNKFVSPLTLGNWPGTSDPELLEWGGISTNKVAFTNSIHITSRLLHSVFLTSSNDLAALASGGVAPGSSSFIPFNEGGAFAATNRLVYDRTNEQIYIKATSSTGFLGPTGVGSIGNTVFNVAINSANAWTFSTDGSFFPQAVYDIGSSSKRSGTIFSTSNNVSGGVSAALITTGPITINSNVVYTPRPFLSYGTNFFSDGAYGTVFTNSHVAAGLTNFFYTNINNGQVIESFIFVGIGSTATLPQFVAADYPSGRIEGLTSNTVNRVTVWRTPMRTNVTVRSSEFSLAAVGNLTLTTNYATGVITISTANDIAVEDLTITNAIAFVNQTLAGVGGANTNFTGLPTHGEVYINGGLTNVNFVAFMPGTAGLTYYLTYNITNLTATDRLVSISSVTNRVQNLQQYHGVAPPWTLTNKHSGILSVKLNSTNAQVSFIQHTNGF